MLSVLALLLGESLLIGGLFLAWPPLALVVAGVQLAAWGLVSDR